MYTTHIVLVRCGHACASTHFTSCCSLYTIIYIIKELNLSLSASGSPTNHHFPSPARSSKQTLEQQTTTLPSFDPVPRSQRASESGRVPSPPVIVKPGLCEWGLEASSDEDGHDSDSSGLGSLIPAVNRSKPHKSKRYDKSVLSDIKTDKSSRDKAGGVSETCQFCNVLYTVLVLQAEWHLNVHCTVKWEPWIVCTFLL